MVVIRIEQFQTRSHPDKEFTINRRKLVICTYIKDMNGKKFDLFNTKKSSLIRDIFSAKLSFNMSFPNEFSNTP